MMVGVVVGGPVVGIDIGSKWYKVAMIQGNSFDIVVDEAGDRRRPSMVAFHDGVRYFGRDAEQLAVRYPDDVFANFGDLLGRNVSVPVPEHVRFGGRLAVDEGRGAWKVRLDARRGVDDDGEEEEVVPELTVEELAAMVLEEARNIASTQAGTVVRDCVIVVPNFYTQRQRRALRDAAEVAGLSVLGMMNVGSAAALQYGLHREKNLLSETQHVMFYDMGYSSTKVSVVEFREGKAKDKPIPVITTVGHGWDAELGGRDFDLVVAEYFMRDADEKLRRAGLGSVYDSRRAQGKIRAQASKVKEVLSANQEAFMSIQDLVPDYDYSGSITRAEFEELSAPLLARVVAPAQRALLNAELTAEDLHFVETIGGGVRVPAVRRNLARELGREELDRHLNGDEAAALGAAFLAATKSPSFKVKTSFRSKDCTGYDVEVDVFEGIHFDQGDSRVTLFKAGNRLGAKKSLSFKIDEDDDQHEFSFRLSYVDPHSLPPGQETADIAVYRILGIPDVEADGLTSFPKVVLSLQLDASGIITIARAEAEVTYMDVEKRAITEEEPDGDGDGDDAVLGVLLKQLARVHSEIHAARHGQGEVFRLSDHICK
mmetsp:Transcript_21383/g.60214  ORF Transcript_21383/g.60214 Transcript_21383/m.60214 type:complete len:599 (+) Transcript_21383:3-1799(+)